MGVSGPEKQILLNLMNHQPDIDKLFSYAKNPLETEYQLFINIVKV